MPSAYTTRSSTAASSAVRLVRHDAVHHATAMRQYWSVLVPPTCASTEAATRRVTDGIASSSRIRSTNA